LDDRNQMGDFGNTDDDHLTARAGAFSQGPDGSKTGANSYRADYAAHSDQEKPVEGRRFRCSGKSCSDEAPRDLARSRKSRGLVVGIARLGGFCGVVRRKLHVRILSVRGVTFLLAVASRSLAASL
jgi:hypothetical protein